MAQPVTVIGSYLSPYVRKVLAVLHLKRIQYRIDPIVAFMGNDEFGKLSPLRRIPVLIDDQVTLTDSSVICEYLDERHPQVQVYPKDTVQRARARWLEEYADTRLGDVLVWQLFNQIAIRPHVWGKPTEDAVVHRALAQDLPQTLDYLETQMPANGFCFGDIGVADVAIGAFFRNAAFVKVRIDAQRWPRAAGLVERVWSHECFQRLKMYEDLLARTPPAKHRSGLMTLGAPLTATTFGMEQPRPGVMRNAET